MLKISEGERANDTITLELAGRVVGPWVGELLQVCDLLLADDNRLALDLAEVSFADENGVAILSSLKRRGVKLVSATPFLEEQLRVSVEAQR